MRLKRIVANNVPPIQKFEVNELSDLVVIAGPNGVGKTRLVNQIISAFRKPNNANVQLEIEPTNDDEKTQFAQNQQGVDGTTYTLNTANSADAQKLTALLHQNRQRRNYKSGVLYYESDRSITNVQPLTYQFEFEDPWTEKVGWDLSLQGLKNRWQDTQHSIFKKIHRQTTSIANRARQIKNAGGASMNLDFRDPLDPFKDAFFQLLGPKKLIKASLQNNQLIYEHEGQEFHIGVLSSGEREVLNIAFDFILRKPSDCIVFFDEPELHLHPELLSRLISTLRSVGVNNQFVLVSHSPEVISSSLNDTVIFLTPKKDDEQNQAVVMGKDDEATEALHRLGQSIGVVSLGKKIVLIEGTDASLDKQTYTHLLKNRFPDLVLLPSGGKGNLHSFEAVIEQVLNKSIWGVEFYMLADRDAFPSGKSQGERLKRLPRYHLENYFLDANILAACFKDMEAEDSWLRSPKQIDIKLCELARQTLGFAVSLIASSKFRQDVGNVNLMTKRVHELDKDQLATVTEEKANAEIERVCSTLDSAKISSFVTETFDELANLLTEEGDGWKKEFPAKAIFSRFCTSAEIREGRLKTAYLARSSIADDDPFEEVVQIFSEFSDFDGSVVGD